MAGTFPNLCLGQQIDANGRPLAGAQLTVYNGGTLQLASCFQDFGLTIPAKNPMTADLTGRLPAFFVTDATYRCVLTDATGISILDITLPSIGPSGGGGGGGGVDPTTIFQTGDFLWNNSRSLRSGWVRANGLTIGSATSGASERANADCQSLFLLLWNTFPGLVVTGGRGVNAAADWAANKQITLLDMRGRVPAGTDGMGNSLAGIIPPGNISSGNADLTSAQGGEANHQLITNELPAHNHGVTDPGHTHSVTDPGHSHTINANPHTHGITDPGHAHAQEADTSLTTAGSFARATTAGANSSQGGTTASATTGVTVQAHDLTPDLSMNVAATGVSIQSRTTGISINNTGGGAVHNNMPPFAVGIWWLKL